MATPVATPPGFASMAIYSNSIGVLLQGSSATAVKMKGLPPRSLKTGPVQ